jgi:hypothetical protein
MLSQIQEYGAKDDFFIDFSFAKATKLSSGHTVILKATTQGTNN